MVVAANPVSNACRTAHRAATAKVTTTYDIISTAINYKNEYKDSLFRELRLIGGKNCLQFALDLLAHIDETSTGIQRVTGLSKLDIK